MATWHQHQAGPIKIPMGYAIMSDAPNQLTTLGTFGENEALARQCLADWQKNQPKLTHSLFYNGKPIN